MESKFKVVLYFSSFNEHPVHGQLDVVNEWVAIEHYKEGIQTKAEMIFDAIESQGFTPPKLAEIESEWMDNSFQWSWLVTANNDEADSQDIELFNQGKKKLWSLCVTAELHHVVETQVTEL